MASLPASVPLAPSAVTGSCASRSYGRTVYTQHLKRTHTHTLTHMFAKYPSISVRPGLFRDVAGEWVASHKVDGTNMSVIVHRGDDDGGPPHVRFARRNGLLDEDETGFYNYQTVLPTLTDWTQLLAMFPGSTQVTVFGEFFGGKYPHPDVAADAAAGKPVQPSIWYCPDKRFAAFDICVDGAFLDVHAVCGTCAAAGIPHIPVMKSGSRAEVLEWAAEHRADDVDPAWYGDTSGLLPIIPGNACEGWVVRPVVDTYHPHDCRVMVKVKNPAFGEGEGGGGGGGKAAVHVPTPMNDETRAAVVRVTAARVANVLGKELETSITMRNFQTLMRLVREDAIADAAKDAAVNVTRVNAKAVNDAVAPLVRSYVSAR